MTRAFTFPILTAEAIDGDTVRCTVDLGFHLSRRVDVRLLGVDAPEMHGASKPAAAIVREWAQGWLETHGELRLWSHEVDKFGRVLGNIKGDNQHGWLADDMLDAGLAKPTSATGKRDPWTQDELDKIVEKANQ